MDQGKLVTYYKIRKFEFSENHTNVDGNAIVFYRPCIGYITKGRVEILYRGQVYNAGEGDVLYIAADTVYYSVWTGNPEIEWYSIDFAYADKTAYSGYRFQIVKGMTEDKFREAYEYRETDELRSVSALYAILSELYAKTCESEYSAEYEKIRPAVEYVENNYLKKITIGELAELCGYSESHFYPLFKRITGVSPVTYKNNYTISVAIKYLGETDLTVEAISEKLGFSSPEYFRRVFKKTVGKPPKCVRNHSRSGS